MAHFQGITAEIISNGQAMDFYDSPDAAETEESHARHHYVEAVAGSTFEVKVELTSQFNFYNMKAEHAVEIFVEINGRDDGSLVMHCTKEYLQEEFSEGKSDICTFTGPTHFCKETGQWMLSDYSFGNLVLRETPDPNFSDEQAQELGKIQITVQRVILEKRRVRYALDKDPITTIDEVPEKALKGRPIETTVRLANARPSAKPTHWTKRSRRFSEEAGKPVVFNIYYRSRRALQMLGCIPRSPSPAIDITVDDADEPAVKSETNSSTMDSFKDKSTTPMTTNAASSNELLRQIQILNARITDLERANLKTEAANTSTIIKDEGVSIKREREEDDGKERFSQRRRTSVKIEHVDLTDD